MKCKQCEYYYTHLTDNLFNKRKNKLHECWYPVRDFDGAILPLKSKKHVYAKDVRKGHPDWCPQAAK